MIDKIREKSCFCFKLFIAVLLVGMVGSNVLQVITRYFISFSIIWVEDVSIYALHWIIAFSMPLLWLMHEHMIMDIVDAWFPRRVLAVLDTVIDCFGVVFGVVLARKSWAAAMVNKGYVLSTLGYDEMWKYIPYVVAGVLLTLAAALNLADTAAKHRGKEPKKS